MDIEVLISELIFEFERISKYSSFVDFRRMPSDKTRYVSKLLMSEIYREYKSVDDPHDMDMKLFDKTLDTYFMKNYGASYLSSDIKTLTRILKIQKLYL